MTHTTENMAPRTAPNPAPRTAAEVLEEALWRFFEARLNSPDPEMRARVRAAAGMPEETAPAVGPDRRAA